MAGCIVHSMIALAATVGACWGAALASDGRSQDAGPCGSSGHDCYSAGAAGCDDASCCATVCDWQAYCCAVAWESACVELAVLLCGPPPNTCGVANHGPFVEGEAGCNDIACCESVCGGEADCCLVAWDSSCVWLASMWCQASTRACGLAAHDCYTQGEAGCSDPLCCELVCQVDASCCATQWDQSCVFDAVNWCTSPPCTVEPPPGARAEAEPCGEDSNGGCTPISGGTSSCCYADSIPFCDDYVCFTTVAAADPFCSRVAWDFICATLATELCPDLCYLGPVAFEPISCGDVIYGTLWRYDGLGDSDWFAIALSESTEVEFTLTTSVYMKFGLVEGDGLPRCESIAEFDPEFSVDECATVSFSRCLEPGTHWVRLYALAGSFVCGQAYGPYILSVACKNEGCVPLDPTNDTCETALPIGEGISYFDTTEATTESLDALGCATFSSMWKDLWYTFTPPTSGVVRISTCNTSSTVNRLTLATGTCGALATVACNDVPSDCPLGGAKIETYVTAGVPYVLRIGASNGSQGSGSISISYLACEPAYDNELFLPYSAGCATGGINAQGVLCGRRNGKAMKWSPEGGFVQITGTLSVANARDINDGGTLVGGTQMNTSMPLQPFVASGSVATILPTLPGTFTCTALAVNNAGVIVGESDSNAVRWVDGIPSLLDLPMGPLSSARDINGTGAICGFMGGSSVPGARHGFVLDGDRVIDLVPPPGASCEANALNDVGQVVGFLQVPSGASWVWRAFLWEAGEYTIIDPWPGFAHSTAIAINDEGVVLGWMSGSGGSVPYVRYGGAAIPIGDLVATGANESVDQLSSINDSGQVAGRMFLAGVGGSNKDTQVRLDPREASADLDCDGIVSGTDLAIVLSAWGPCVPYLTCIADVTFDGVVDGGDLAVLLGSWTR